MKAKSAAVSGSPSRRRRTYPERSDRKLNTTSTLLAELVADGWIAGEKHCGQWRWRPAVSRSEGLQQLARIAVADFSGASVTPGSWSTRRSAPC
jgi:predicted transcriptional regulator